MLASSSPCDSPTAQPPPNPENTMATAPFHHGIRVTEVSEGINSIRIVSTAVIGLVATASDADAATFPLNRPVLVTKVDAAIGKAGTKGTLALALNAIKEQCRPVLVVVRVADGEGATEAERRTDQDAKVIGDRKSTRLNSSHLVISYAVFCLK